MLRVSKVAQQYAGRDVAVGERFDVEEGHISLLLHLGRIEPEDGEPWYVEPAPRETKPKKRGASK